MKRISLFCTVGTTARSRSFLQHAIGELRHGERVGQVPDVAVTTHARERELHVEREGRLRAPGDRERQHVALGVIADIGFDFGERKAGAFGIVVSAASRTLFSF